MSITVKGAGKSLWEPSLDIGRCFAAQVRSFEEMLHIKSGVTPIIADTVEINSAQFEDFVALCLGRLERSQSGELLALTAGCLEICIALNWKMGGKLPPISPKLKPLLAGADAFQRQNCQ